MLIPNLREIKRRLLSFTIRISIYIHELLTLTKHCKGDITSDNKGLNDKGDYILAVNYRNLNPL